MTKGNNEGFYPNVKGKKRKFAEMLVNPEFDGNISKLCDSMNVSRSSYYRWMNDMEFMSFCEWLIDKYTDSELANVWRATIKAAKEGNTNAQRLYFELKGRFVNKVELNGGVTIISGEDELE